ncbi:DinB family protein [Ulvibacter sp. MAR_2010_11]|nr:DinB family protein [Ulvibacter sp. MAR_2010_11]
MIETNKLISELTELTRQNIESVERMLPLPMDELNWRKDPTSWSVLECISHLNRYSDFYIPEIKLAVNKNKFPSDAIFYPGRLGNYFTNAIRVKGALRKMKTLKSMDPIGSTLSKGTLTQFILDQKQLLMLLEDAEEVNLNKTKTAISVSTLLKLKLGDTLRFVVYHNERHILQAFKVLELQKSKVVLENAI